MPKPRNFYEYFHDRRVEVLREMLDNRGFSSPLDVGCGLGMLGWIGVNGAVGIDIRKGGAVTIRATAESLPFQDSVFDLVFAGEVLEHLDRPGQALREWVRVLRSKGAMVISTPNGILVSPTGGNPEHKALYAPEDVTRVLRKLGLRIVESKGIFSGLIPGNRSFRLIPFGRVKATLLRIPVPLCLSYSFVLMGRKES